jgi:hypothetical protein
MRLLLLALTVVTLLPFVAARAAGGAELSLSASNTLVSVGEPVVVYVRASTGGQTVNAIEGEIAYNPADFSVENISIEGSILSTWSTAPSYDSATGLIHFSGWADAAYTGSGGLLATVTLLPLRVGQSSLDFNSGAMLATDGKGSNIITGMKSLALRIQPKASTTPAPQPIQEATTSTVVPVSADAPSTLAPVNSSSPTSPVMNNPNAAAVVQAGMELAPILIPFFAALILIAFGIAFVLHRIGR